MQTLPLLWFLLAQAGASPAGSSPWPPAPPDRPPQYGDAGTSEASLLLGFSSGGGFGLGAGYRYFVVDGVAPGAEASYFHVDGREQGWLLRSLRLVPVRLSSFALALTGRAGRVLLSDHSDGWAAGGQASLVLASAGGHVGFEVGVDILRLFPASFCADLSTCTLVRPILGLRVIF